jgi:hypothetical protein
VTVSSIVVTIGSALANSYVTVAEFDQYCIDRVPNDNYTTYAADTDRKKRALLTATQRLDQFYYEGNVVDKDQALQYPRYGSYGRNGWAILGTEIPEDLKRAQMELAYIFLVTDHLKNTGLENFEELKVEGITLKMVRPQDNSVIPEHVYRFIEPLIGHDGARVALELS